MNQIYQFNNTSTTIVFCVLLNVSLTALTTPLPKVVDKDSSNYYVDSNYIDTIDFSYWKTMTYTAVQLNTSSPSKVDLFLNFLERDIQNNLQNLQVIDSDLISYVQSLFTGEDIDIDAPIYDED